MSDTRKTKKQLIEEVETLRAEVATLRETTLAGNRDTDTFSQHLAHLVSNVTDAIVILDEDQQIVEFNKGAERIFGYSANEVTGQPLDILLPQRYASIHQSHIEHFAIEPGASRFMNRDGPVVGLRKDGTEFHAESTISKHSENGQTLFAVILRDITQRHHVNTETRMLLDLMKSVREAGNFRAAIETSLRLVCKYTSWAYGEAWLLNSEGTSLVNSRIAYHDSQEEAFETFQLASESLTFGPGEGLPGRVWQKREHEWNKNVAAVWNKKYTRVGLARQAGLKTAFGVPIISHDQVLAVLVFYMTETRAEDEWLIELVSAAASELGMLMRRKQVEDLLQEANTGLEAQVTERTLELENAIGQLRLEIAERGQVEIALRESEARLAEAQRIAHLGNWVWEIPENVLWWSDEIYRIFGLTPQAFEATYEAFLSSVHPDDRSLVEESVTAALREKKAYSIDHRIVLPGDEVRIVHERAEVTFDDQTGEPVRMVGTVQDVTEQRRTEEQLRKLSSAVEQSASVILITDTSGKIEYVNSKFTKMTGYSAEEAIGQTPNMLNSGLTPPDTFDHLWRAISTGEEWRGEILNKKKNGELFWAAEAISPIKNEEGITTHYLAVEEDITEQKRAESETQFLSELTRAIGEAPSFDVAMSATLRMVSEFGGWIYGEAWLCDANDKVMKLSPVWHNGKPDDEKIAAFRQVSETFTFKPGKGLPGRIWQMKKPEWHADISSLPKETYTRAQHARNANLGTALGVPIIGDEQTLAVLVFYMAQKRELDARLLELVSTTGIQLGTMMQRKKAEEELRNSREFLATLMKTVADTIFTVEMPARKIKYVNFAVKDIFGYDPEEVTGQTTRMFYPDDASFAAFGQNLTEAFAQGKSEVRAEYQLIKKNGAQLWADISTTFIFSESELSQVVSVVRDITERKQIEEAEREQRALAQALQKATGQLARSVALEDTLDLIVDQLNEVIEYDWATVMLSEGQGLRTVIAHGFPNPEELLGTTLEYMDIPLFSEAINTGRPLILFDGEDDKLWTRLPGIETPPRSWIGMPLVAWDVIIGLLSIGSNEPEAYDTYHLEAIEVFAQQAALAVENARITADLETSLRNLRQAQDLLVQAARLSAAGEIAAGVAHQISNPLAAIQMQAHLVAQRLSPESPNRRAIQIIDEAARRASSVVRRLLDLSKSTAYDMVPVDINESVASAVSLVRAQTGPGAIRFDIELASSLPVIQASEQHLSDLWLNLLMNAKDAVSELENGVIKMSTALSKAGDEIVVIVQDNGAGIPPKDIERIFDPFFTTKGTAEGTGLGLAICHDVVTRHGGAIKVESKGINGQGAKFSIRLPV